MTDFIVSVTSSILLIGFFLLQFAIGLGFLWIGFRAFLHLVRFIF